MKMQLKLKRMAAVLLAVVMSMCCAVTAFAADEGTAKASGVQSTGTLRVTGSGLWVPGTGENNESGKTVTAIRMFTARVTAGDEGTNGYDTYTLDSA